MPAHLARLGIGTTIAAMCLVAVSAQSPADPPARVALYAGVGEEEVDTHGFTPRTFSLDPAGRLLVVGNQNSVSVSEGGSTKLVPANLAVFRVGSNGTLTFVQRYDVAVARKPLWWMGIVASR